MLCNLSSVLFTDPLTFSFFCIGETSYYWASLVAQTVKRLPTMQETRVQSLGREVPLEKEMATHSSIHAWKNPMDGGAW